jgi:proteic killer suppression protein
MVDACNLKGYNFCVIKTFKHKGLKKLFEDDDRSGIQPIHADKLLDILDRLEASSDIQDMRYPGSGLHQLQGDRKGEWSLTVSKNWRVTFIFQDGDAYDVNYEDYH